MDVNTFSSDKDEIYESNPPGVMSPANLDIDEEEWNLLICTDSDLAAQLGCYLLKRNKELETLIETAENCAKEHQTRANHFEKQVQYVRKLFETQSKTYETFENQVQDLTINYQQMSAECRQYKERNKSLWKTVESLEQKCEDYLTELDLLKSNQVCNIRNNSRKESLDIIDDIDSMSEEADDPEELESDLVSLKAFAEETARKLDIEQCQRLNREYKIEKLFSKVKDLENYILLLEHRLNSQESHNSLKCEAEEKLTKSQSMLSLMGSSYIEDEFETHLEEKDDLNDIRYYQYRKDSYCGEQTEELSLKDLFQKLNNVGSGSERKNENISHFASSNQKEIEMRSDSRKLKHVLTNRTLCNNCSSSDLYPESEMMNKQDNTEPHKEQVKSTTKLYDNEENPAEMAATNYRDIFAQIFEKLKISRDNLNKTI